MKARYPDSDETHGSPKALAYLIGKPGGPQVIVAWGFLSDTRIGRSKHWQPWLESTPMLIEIDLKNARFSDLYGRSTSTVSSRDGLLKINVGEEPAFVRIQP
ncbi:MAG: hypothetical protein PF795_03950 [Kiritimatiellae bacterium]|nr:hypothetical protein [Kiritimatiellia bacterium]